MFRRLERASIEIPIDNVFMECSLNFSSDGRYLTVVQRRPTMGRARGVTVVSLLLWEDSTAHPKTVILGEGTDKRPQG